MDLRVAAIQVLGSTQFPDEPVTHDPPSLSDSANVPTRYSGNLLPCFLTKRASSEVLMFFIIQDRALFDLEVFEIRILVFLMHSEKEKLLLYEKKIFTSCNKTLSSKGLGGILLSTTTGSSLASFLKSDFMLIKGFKNAHDSYKFQLEGIPSLLNFLNATENFSRRTFHRFWTIFSEEQIQIFIIYI